MILRKKKTCWKSFKKIFYIFPDLLLEKNVSRFINISIFFSTTILLIQIVQLNTDLKYLEEEMLNLPKTEEMALDLLDYEEYLYQFALLLILNFVFLFLQFIQVNYANYYLFKKKIILKIIGLVFTLIYLLINILLLNDNELMRSLETYSICVCYSITILYYFFLIVNDFYKNKFLFFSCFEEDLTIYYHEYTYQLLNKRPSVYWKQYIKNNKREMNIKLYISLEKKLYKKSDLDFFKLPEKKKFFWRALIKIGEVFIPFFTFKKRLKIGNIIHYPTKIIIAVTSSLYIYYNIMVYLLILVDLISEELENPANGELFEVFTKVKPLLKAIKLATTTTVVIESMYLFIISFYLFIHFKESILKLRRGKKKFKGYVKAYNSINFLPTYLSNLVIGESMLSLVLFILLTTLYTPMFWEFVWSKRAVIQTIVATRIFMFIVLYIMRCLTFNGNCIIRRRLLYFFDILNFFLGFISGLAKQASRALYAVVGSLFLVFRVDEPVIIFLGLDAVYHSYCGLMYFYHMHNNPIVNTFTNMFLEEIEMRKEERERKLKRNRNKDKAEKIKRDGKNISIKESIQKNSFIIENPNDNEITKNSINEEKKKKKNDTDNNEDLINEKIKINNSTQKYSLQKDFKDGFEKGEDIKLSIYNEEELDEAERIRKKKKRIIDRFHFCVFLARNPSLVKWRKKNDLTVKK